MDISTCETESKVARSALAESCITGPWEASILSSRFASSLKQPHGRSERRVRLLRLGITASLHNEPVRSQHLSSRFASSLKQPHGRSERQVRLLRIGITYCKLAMSTIRRAEEGNFVIIGLRSG